MSFWGWLLSGGGIGFLPVAPASWASLLAVGIGWVTHELVGVEGIFLWAFALTLVGLCGISQVHLPSGDPQWVVIDEMSMQMWVLAWLPNWNLQTIGGAFVLFRFWDVVKLFPAAPLEKLPPPWGIVLDDAVAAFWTLLCLQLFT